MEVLFQIERLPILKKNQKSN
uniref:Uncharacterized protein n=1 Tax=Rhizophora mucronata TaxID=61149 RepID=A0A2P2Q571_RHIMU